MSRLDELIAELCPHGVEYYELGNLGKFYGGLTGKSKSDFTDGNAKFITYRNVYSNPALRLEVDDTVKIGVDEKQRTLEYGDVIFTGSSETADECGISSVLTIKTDEKLYLNSFCFVFRFNGPNIMLPDFAKHLFRSSNLRYQIGKTASGVTRFNVSKKLMEKVVVPVPPLEVQREIVRVLDSFTLLTAELTAELTARREQYEYYEHQLLSFNHKDIEYKPIGEIATVTDYVANGSFADLKKNVEYKHYPDYATLIRTVDYSNGFDADKFIYIDEKAYNFLSKSKLYGGEIIINNIGAGVGTTFRCPKLETNMSLAPNSIMVRTPCDDFYYYWFRSRYGQEAIKKVISKSAMPKFNKTGFKTIMVPVPPIEEQKRIISILDRFDTLCNDLSSGLPAEIETRRKQYEYYRDKLLTFKELS